jgi:protein-tyrosine phosphatase
MTGVVDRPGRAETAGVFAVLCVCRANQVRSPLAMFEFRRSLAVLRIPWTVNSAGTQVVGYAPLPTVTHRALSDVGLAAAGYGSVRLRPAMIDEADLVLAADTETRSEVALLEPASLNKLFTIRQFARYASLVQLDSTEPARLGPDLLAGARIARTRFQPAQQADNDIPDPGTLEYREVRATYDVIAAAIQDIIRPLAESPAILSARKRTTGRVAATRSR